MNRNQILNECIVIFDRHLQANLKSAMNLTLKKLFKLAENATSNQDEQSLFTQYRQLKSGAKSLSSGMRTQIKSMPEFISAEVNKSDNKMSLSLVEDEELSISLSLTQLDSTLEVVSHAELYTLEKRMNVIFGNEKIDKTNMPFSPASIVWLFSHAFKSVDFEVQVKTMIIDFVTKEFSGSINEAYKEINQVFIDAGILPNLQPEVSVTSNQDRGVKTEPETDAQTDAPSEAEDNEQSPMPNQTGSGPVTSRAASNAAPGTGQNEIAAGEYQQTQSRQFDPQTKQLVESIFDLLSPPKGSAVQSSQGYAGGQSQGGDAAQGQGAANGAPQVQKIADNDFDKALSQISQESGIVATSKNIHNLKEMLADQVKNNTGNYYPELSPKQNKTLDLMGMVYDEIEKDDSIDSHIRSSFNAINVPLLRMAVNDENFFTDAAHPARKFMELLVDSSQKWHGTNIIKQIHQYSDSAAKSFDGSTQSFVGALKELTQYLEVTENRAKKAEQKWVSAAQGKEKMELTKAEVESHLDEILEGCDIKFIRDIIQHVWKDSLTLTLLREGKDSEQWQKKTKSAKIISQIGNKNEFMKLSGPDKLAAMHHLDQTMDELGFSKRDRISTKDNIHSCLGWQESDEKEQQEVKPKLKKVLSIDEAVKSQEIESSNKKIEEIRELNDNEKLIMEQVINMPYGTMFDFVINQQKETLRRKLSWVSTMSETVLFVDLVGRHPHKMKLPRLAIDIHRNNIIKVEVQEGGYFRKALSNIMDRLKKMAA
ncbi:DUF1631 family protein [Marinicella sp. S1101]|uniref:DUF1631 family protein n=1 Tax=Marinicella marina TaxID=2996016 RepID=UPI002260A127|nr:DUF1631 family protein [Marinicella marina]MCX7552458.1 DUF1631 family protein [Marinicella marina]MDJ1139334.1 DUF1631 family protein [Marinicella marina]